MKKSETWLLAHFLPVEPGPSRETRQERLAGLLVKRAEETGVTFVEQTDLMTGIGALGHFCGTVRRTSMRYMSKKSNVHPDHYETAGRVPQGPNVVRAIEREALRQQQAQEERTAVKSKGAEKGEDESQQSLP